MLGDVTLTQIFLKWYKLYKIGINGKMLKIIKDMYSQVKACVRGCNSYSDFFEMV